MSTIEWMRAKQFFGSLGGFIDNVEPRIGSRGRGLFAIEPKHECRVFCPKSILLDTRHIDYNDSGQMCIRENANISSELKNFYEFYYNYWCWNGGGRTEALTFFENLLSLRIDFRHKLVANGLLAARFARPTIDEESLFKRYIYTRTARYEGLQVLAPIFDLVNHSAFAQPFRNTSTGIETPRRVDNQELLQKYSSMMSPLGVWNHYGFSCKSTVAYSLPVTIINPSSPYIIECLGEQVPSSNSKGNNISINGETLTIRSFPIGSVSRKLSSSTLHAILQPLGISQDSIFNIMRKLWDFNYEQRIEMLQQAHQSTTGKVVELDKALRLELALIGNSCIT
jgi:hypothetical protein